MEITETFLEACPTPKSKDIELLEFAVKGTFAPSVKLMR